MQVIPSILASAWHTVALMAPWLLLGMAIAGLMSAVIPSAFIRRHLGAGGPWTTLKAAVLGIPLPICSCGIVPLVASLRERGASRAASLSFLIATPQTSVDSIVLCAILIGPWFALFSPLTALAAAMVGSLLLLLVGARRTDGAEQGGAGACPRCHAPAGAAQAADEAPRPAWPRRILYEAAVSIPRRIGKEMLIGIAIAGLVAALVPEAVMREWGGTGLLPKLLMVAAAVPVYVCSSASVAVAAALVASGVSPGTALVFLIAGPATNAATVMAVRKLLGWAVLPVYLASVIGVAIGAGLLLDAIGPATTGVFGDAHDHGPGLAAHLAAGVLFLLLLQAFLPARWLRRGAPGFDMAGSDGECPTPPPRGDA